MRACFIFSYFILHHVQSAFISGVFIADDNIELTREGASYATQKISTPTCTCEDSQKIVEEFRQYKAQQDLLNIKVQEVQNAILSTLPARLLVSLLQLLLPPTPLFLIADLLTIVFSYVLQISKILAGIFENKTCFFYVL